MGHHWAEMGRRGGLAGRGKPHSSEHNARVGAGMRRFYETGECASHRQSGAFPMCSFISLSRVMGRTLLAEFPEVCYEVQFGKYSVDAYLPPPYHLAFEADGSYWHTMPDRIKRDQKRDQYLRQMFDLPVVRLTEEIEHTAKSLKEAQL